MEALGLLRGLPLGAVEGLERAEAVIGRYRPPNVPSSLTHFL
jgi:hypothetical protein